MVVLVTCEMREFGQDADEWTLGYSGLPPDCIRPCSSRPLARPCLS